jgi:hemerythrin-like domain-containing protein
MAVQIGAKPDSGFDDPIGMLKDCHRRIESFLNVLCIVAESDQARSLNEDQTDAIRAALHYFRVGGQRHNADEEESLFPRLRAEPAMASFEEIPGLESDHRTANELHATVEELYEAWIADRCLSAASQERLLAATQMLKRLYEEHIQIEERIVFPRASEVLDAGVIARIGEEFRARRR